MRETRPAQLIGVTVLCMLFAGLGGFEFHTLQTMWIIRASRWILVLGFLVLALVSYYMVVAFFISMGLDWARRLFLWSVPVQYFLVLSFFAFRTVVLGKSAMVHANLAITPFAIIPLLIYLFYLWYFTRSTVKEYFRKHTIEPVA